MDTTRQSISEEQIKTIVQDVSGKLTDKGARNMEIINVHEQTTLADYFVICTGTSNTHIRTLAQEVEHHIEQTYGIRPHHIEGYDNAQWVLVDYVFMVVHIFRQDVREFYSLERLWS